MLSTSREDTDITSTSDPPPQPLPPPDGATVLSGGFVNDFKFRIPVLISLYRAGMSMIMRNTRQTPDTMRTMEPMDSAPSASVNGKVLSGGLNSGTGEQNKLCFPEVYCLTIKYIM